MCSINYSTHLLVNESLITLTLSKETLCASLQNASRQPLYTCEYMCNIYEISSNKWKQNYSDVNAHSK